MSLCNPNEKTPQQSPLGDLAVNAPRRFSASPLDKTDFSEAVLKRFFKRVDTSPHPKGCHLWKTKGNPDAYGAFRIGDRNHRATRVAYAIAFGKTPEGLQMCHHCDNPPCVNPSHLFLGTHMDNAMDRDKKGRRVKPVLPRGEKHPNHKLTDDEVLKIRTEYAAGGITQKELARKYSISQPTISVVILRTRWTHLP